MANMIKGGKFTLDGVEYTLPVNNPPSNLHGGEKGFDKVQWEVIEHYTGEKPHITFKYHNWDGREGYPGDVTVTATYSILSSTTLRLDMEAVPSDKATLVNLAQHTCNLVGHNSGDVLNHFL